VREREREVLNQASMEAECGWGMETKESESVGDRQSEQAGGEQGA